MTDTSKKEGYESIPDVERGDAGSLQNARNKYPDLSDDQADLIYSFDEAIAGSSVSLALPQTSPEEMASQGANFLRSIVTPTLTSIGTFAVAFYLQTMEEIGPWIELLFPYVNATIVFGASVGPMQTRFLSAAVPIFDQVERAQEKVDKGVSQLRETFDESLDQLQAKAEKVMEPIKPTLAKAQPYEAQIKAVHPDLEVPDQDLDEEFNEMRELVQPKLDEAQKLLHLDECVPWFLRTPQDFFWYVVFPVLLLAFVLQLVVAWFTSSLVASQPDSSFPGAADAVRRMLQEVVDSVKEQAQSLQDEAQAQAQALEDQAQAQAEALRNQAQEQYDALQDQARAGVDELHSQFDAKVAESKSMLLNVAVSYGMALLQMGFVFLISSPRVRAWVINLVLRIMTNKAMRVLRDSGVETAFEDVFQTKMTKTRDTLLKLIGAAEKISKVVGFPTAGLTNLFGGGGSGGAGEVSSPAATLTNVLSPTSSESPGKRPGLIGRMFSGRGK